MTTISSRNSWKTRFAVLVTGLVMAAAVVAAQAGPAGPAGPGGPGDNDLVGTWRATVTPDGGPAFSALQNFNGDGTLVEFDNSGPPSQQTTAVGPWKSTGKGKYQFYSVNQIFDPSGGYAGEVRVHASITLSKDGKTFTSTFAIQVVDPTGAPIFNGTGTATGKKITI